MNDFTKSIINEVNKRKELMKGDWLSIKLTLRDVSKNIEDIKIVESENEITVHCKGKSFPFKLIYSGRAIKLNNKEFTQIHELLDTIKEILVTELSKNELEGISSIQSSIS